MKHRFRKGRHEEWRAVQLADPCNAVSRSRVVKIRIAPLTGIHKIRHIVIMQQENRSFDSYFGTFPGADGIPHGVCVPDPHGGCVAPFHDSSDLDYGGPHAAASAFADIAGGAMNGFVTQSEHGQGRKTTNPSCSPCQQGHQARCIGVMGYHDAREIPNYWA